MNGVLSFRVEEVDFYFPQTMDVVKFKILLMGGLRGGVVYDYIVDLTNSWNACLKFLNRNLVHRR